jgi:Restriction Enzyme Adenine Methylase Associated
MAAVVKEAIGLLADHSYDPAYPAATTTVQPPISGGWTGYGISVKDLLTAELLTAGTLLLPARDDLDAIAEVLVDGRIRLDEETYDTPSGAARAAAGMAANGWTFWVADTSEGPRKLAELRASLVGDGS